METTRRSPFGNALRRLREAAGLSQEQLAERAGLSVRGISDLERGLRTTPRLETVKMLADGLGLDETGRIALLDARNARRQSMSQSRVYRPSSLPVPPTSFIGREEEIQSIIDDFENQETRLLTIVGPGGVGKTRIAIEVAHRLVGRYTDEAVFVDLSPIRNTDRVIEEIAARLGAIAEGGIDIRERLLIAIQDRSLLLVLDNLEQVIDVGIDIARLLEACPNLGIIATSRARMRVGAEHVFPLEPMTLPNDHDLISLNESEAALLFLVRARAADPGFALDSKNAADIAALVTRLQGMPLAVELAAARTRLLSIPDLVGRLDSQLPVLTGGARDAPERHRTMRDTIAWSYNLLSSREQAVFRTLSIFPVGCTLETAVALLGVDNRFGETESIAAVGTLVDHSLLRHREGSDGRTRYRMLRTIQEFGLEQLQAAGEEQPVRQAAYRYWCAPLVRESEFVLFTPKPELWLDHIGAEYQNLRGQVYWLIEHDSVEEALDISIALATFSSLRGHLEDSRQQLELLLAHPRLQTSTVGRMRGLIALGIVCKYQADSGRSYAVLRESVQLAHELEQLRHIPVALYNLGIATADIGQVEDAEALFSEVVAGGQAHASKFIFAAAYRKLARIAEYRGQPDRSHRLALESLNISLAEGHTWNVALAKLFLGEHSVHRGNLDQAERLTMDAKSMMEQLGNRALTPYMLAALANIFVHRQDLARAEELLEDALDLARDLGITREIASLYCDLGHIAWLKGKVESAKTFALRSLAWFERFGDVVTAVRCLILLSDITCQSGEFSRAAWCMGAADGVLVKHGIHRTEVEAGEHQLRIERVSTQLGQEEWQSHYNVGYSTTMEGILADVRSWQECK